MSSINVLMIGAGEYTTGYVHDSASRSDKTAGVVALTMFDLRARGLVDQIAIAGTNGCKMPAIREHLQTQLGDRYHGLDVSCTTYPADNIPQDRSAYQTALRQMQAGDVVTVFTPDNTHGEIAQHAIRRGCHVLIAKPTVKTLMEHRSLQQSADQAGVLVATEMHKRWDPIYADARDRIRQLGDFSFFHSYMSQPQTQLDTFRQWAGKASDISYYLNAHHIDFHVWSVSSFARPVAVRAVASDGVARSKGIDTEDSISLIVTWQNRLSANTGTAIYTSSWIAPKSDVHSQQRFFYAGHLGELHVDQAHRGYTLANIEQGFASLNPLFMKYAPDANGCFCGQSAYGYRSIADFIEAAVQIKHGLAKPDDYTQRLATIDQTESVTAILQAGRISLDRDGECIDLNDSHFDD